MRSRWRTLSYFDNLNLCDYVTCPVLMSLGLQDRTCSPSVVFAVCYRPSCEKKEVGVYPYHNHENIDRYLVDNDNPSG